MQYATMRGQGGVTVTIPKLEGGVNLSDLPTQVEDNQLTAVNNMWWHQGVLRTRSGLTQVGGGDFGGGLIGKSRISEQEEILFQVEDSDDDSVTVRADSFSVNGTKTIRRFSLNCAENYRTALGVRSENDDSPYLIFTGDGEILQSWRENTVLVEEPYVPHVTVDGDGESGSDRVTYEGYNMLTGAFRCSYTTNGEKESFLLPQKELDAEHAVEITLSLKDGENTKDIAVTISPNDSGEYGTTSLSADDGITSAMLGLGADTSAMHPQLAFSFNWRTGVLEARGSAVYGEGDRVYKPLPFVTSNNLEITAHKTVEGQRYTICRMTRCTWFGGTRSGLDSGTRLFVTGNPGKPHLVHWSDVNKPLYFPENNYFYVGDADQRVTALAQQGDLLVIFKEHQLYCSQYIAGSAITRDDLISGKVTDIAALTAQFPLTPLHSTIGCDCPDTIRLVNNRLVWATSDAHVYMLPSVNQYSERNVRDITALIRRDLEKHTADELKAAVATEYKGHYMLILPDGTAYLLDVGNSAFQSYAYYASEKKANRALPWYIWKFGKDGERFWSVVSTGDEIRMLANDVINREYTLEGEDDGGRPIACSFTTKLFDFGRGDVKKAITHLYLGVADSPTNTVRVSYITDAYTAEDAYIIESGGDHNEREPGYIRTHRLTPNIHRVRLFGIRCDSEGAMAVDGIQIKMKPQGVVR